MPRRKPATLGLTEDLAFAEIAKRPSGVSRPALMRRFGLNDTLPEEERGRVWRLNAALVNLQRKKMVVSDVQGGNRYYYPQAS
jgi:hypothetical protein